MIETERCLICGHDRREHDHGTLCWRCECPIFHDQNEQKEAIHGDD